MAKQTLLNGLKELRSYLSTINKSNSIFILFTGSKDEKGHSWCPDCNTADPVIHNCIKYLNQNSELITCIVGDRPTWKDPNNELRLDKEFSLKCIPTLVKWKTNQKLLEEQCADENLLKMLFQEDD